MPSAGTVSVDAVLNSAEFNAGLKRMSEQVGELGRNLEATGDFLKTWGERLIGFEAAKVAAETIQQTAEAIEHLYNASVNLDVPIEKLVEFRIAAETSGAGVDALTNALFQMERRIGGGNKEAIKYLEAMGLDIDALKKMRGDQALEVIAGAIMHLGSAQERNAASQAIFGRSIQEMLPALREIAEGNDFAREAAEKFGLKLTEFDAVGAKLGKRAFDELKLASQGFATQLTLAATPYLIAFAAALNQVDEPARAVRESLDKAFATFYVFVAALENGVHVLKAFAAGFAAFQLMVTDLLTGGLLGRFSDSFKKLEEDARAATERELMSIKTIDQIQQGLIAVLEARDAAVTKQLEKNAKDRADATNKLNLAGPPKSIVDWEIEALDSKGKIYIIKVKNYYKDIYEIRQKENEKSQKLIAADLDKELDADERHRRKNLAEQEKYYETMRMLEEKYTQSVIATREIMLDSISGLLSVLAQRSRAAAIALIVLEKARAIAGIIVNFEEAKALAMAVLPPGAAEARVAQLTVMEAISIGTVAATGLVEIANTANGGGGGGGGGLGTPANSTFQTNAGAANNPYKNNVTEVYVKGQVTDQSGRILVNLISDQIKAGDVVLFDLSSRQARNLGLHPK